MKHFHAITNLTKDKDFFFTKEIRSYVLKKGGTFSYGSNRDINIDDIPPETECIFCVGGDGTFIRAALDVVERRIPLIGINRGHIGYLCELDGNTVYPAIDQLMEDRYEVEQRILLESYCIVDGEISPNSLALNDVVIHRSGQPQMINLIIYVNGEYLSNYSGDGMIIATPTGSTGYSLTAGGPIVDPMADLVLINPVNSQSLHAKCIVLEAEHEIVVEVGCRHRSPSETAEVSFDGDPYTRLSVGDKIVIRKADVEIQVIKLNKLSFVEMLRRKMR